MPREQCSRIAASQYGLTRSSYALACAQMHPSGRYSGGLQPVVASFGVGRRGRRVMPQAPQTSPRALMNVCKQPSSRLLKEERDEKTFSWCVSACFVFPLSAGARNIQPAARRLRNFTGVALRKWCIRPRYSQDHYHCLFLLSIIYIITVKRSSTFSPRCSSTESRGASASDRTGDAAQWLERPSKQRGLPPL